MDSVEKGGNRFIFWKKKKKIQKNSGAGVEAMGVALP